MAITKGAHHIGLTVSDLTATRNFFVNTLGFEQAGEVPNYPAVFVADGTVMITLWQANNPQQAIPFDRKNNIGLHHFALKVENLEALKSLHQTLLNTSDVEIEFAPELSGNGPAHHMMCYIPGGIRMEFVTLGS